MGVKFRVAHASAIVEDVQRAFGSLGVGSSISQEGMDNRMQFPIVKFGATRRCPWLTFTGRAEDRLSRPVQGLFGVVSVENLSSLRE